MAVRGDSEEPAAKRARSEWGVDARDVDERVLDELPADVASDVRRDLGLARSMTSSATTTTTTRTRPQGERAGPRKSVAAAQHPTDDRDAPKKKKKKRAPSYRQARETASGEVEVLCFSCRRAPRGAAQASLTRFFAARPPGGDAAVCARKTRKEAPHHEDDDDKQRPTLEEEENGKGVHDAVVRVEVCARCRLPLSKKGPKTRGGENNTSPGTTGMNAKPVSRPPQIARLLSYKRLASESRVPFALTDGEALAIMREPCVGCGALKGRDGNGLSRLRDWTGFSSEARSRARKPYMGPFSRSNCVAACATCNRMKGARRVASFVEAARTIATHRTGLDFGRYPRRFRDNVSKRSRSSYIAQSSTHTKTHALTNAQFNSIVARPCYYCGKAPSPTHHNGLDRLDSDDRVYRVDNVVPSCGDCNLMKYKHTLDFFVSHCVKVATHHLGVVFHDDDDDDDDDQDYHHDNKPDDDDNDDDGRRDPGDEKKPAEADPSLPVPALPLPEEKEQSEERRALAFV